MQQQMVYAFLNENFKKFPKNKLQVIEQKLYMLPDDKYEVLRSVKLLKPGHVTLFSVFLGMFGVDRFVLGDIGLGVLKLITHGFCGILYIIDWFLVSKAAKEKNFREIMLIN